jgi:uncharacterized membrane protein
VLSGFIEHTLPQLARSFLKQAFPEEHKDTRWKAFAIPRTVECEVPPPAPLLNSTVLDETDVGCALAEALTADVHAVLSDETTLVTAHTAARTGRHRKDFI